MAVGVFSSLTSKGDVPATTRHDEEVPIFGSPCRPWRSIEHKFQIIPRTQSCWAYRLSGRPIMVDWGGDGDFHLDVIGRHRHKRSEIRQNILQAAIAFKGSRPFQCFSEERLFVDVGAFVWWRFPTSNFWNPSVAVLNVRSSTISRLHSHHSDFSDSFSPFDPSSTQNEPK